MRVTVTWLFVLGDGVVPGSPLSFSTMCMMACPRSPNTVGHGATVVHEPPEETSVNTSDTKCDPAMPAVAATNALDLVDHKNDGGTAAPDDVAAGTCRDDGRRREHARNDSHGLHK